MNIFRDLQMLRTFIIFGFFLAFAAACTLFTKPKPETQTPSATFTFTLPVEVESVSVSPTFAQSKITPVFFPYLSRDVWNALVINSTFCHKGPGNNYDLIKTYESGVNLKIIGRNADSSWWWVHEDDSQANCYISAGLLQVSGNLTNVPVIPDPPSPTPIPASSTQLPISPTFTLQPPAIQTPATEPPDIAPPATQILPTEALQTPPPPIEVPTTQAPTTEAPTTQAPATEAPTTQAPTTTEAQPTPITPDPTHRGSPPAPPSNNYGLQNP